MSFASITSLIIEYRYWILLPLSFVEGPIVAFLAGTLASLGYFNIYVLAAFFLIRDVIVDLLCYSIGRFTGKTNFLRKLLHRVGVTDEEMEDIRLLWNHHPGKTMFFSKLSFGFAAALIVVAGMVRMPFNLFMLYGFLVALLQYGTLLFIGYFFGSIFGTTSAILEKIQYAVAGGILIIIAYYIFKRYVSKRLKQAEKLEEIEH